MKELPVNSTIQSRMDGPLPRWPAGRARGNSAALAGLAASDPVNRSSRKRLAEMANASLATMCSARVVSLSGRLRSCGFGKRRWRWRTTLGGEALTILAAIPTAGSAHSVFGQDPSTRWAVFPVVVDPARSPRIGNSCVVRGGLALVRTRGR
jgi:hypothetical protein